MAKLTVPQRGQPLDVSYMYQLVETVNQLSDIVGTNQSVTQIKNDKSGTSNTVGTGRASIVGITAVVASSKDITATDNQVPFSVNYNFKHPPIVVATPFDTGNTNAGKNVSVVITQVTASTASFLVRFNTVGVATVDVNVLAIGIPN
jgi:hypothetical protein